MLSSFIIFFLLSFVILRLFVVRPLRADFQEGQEVLEELKQQQEDQVELLEQIDQYRNGLYALNLVLEARKNIVSGSDEQNPYLVYDYTQVIDDLRRLLPQDARVTKFQVNPKGLVTLPIESVDYASLGRVLKSFKDKSEQSLIRPEEPKLFTEVKIPSGAQRALIQTGQGRSTNFEEVYSFVIQAQLSPEFWQNPMPYPDVDPLAYYAQAIRDMTLAGTIEGYPEGTFKPNQDITRAEFFKVALFEFLSNDAITIEEYQNYIDLSEEDWHYQYVQLASQMGVAEGDEEKRFHPQQTIARGEALKTLLTVFEIEIPTLEEYQAQLQIEQRKSKEEDGSQASEPIKALPFKALPFADVDSKNKYYSVVRVAMEEGILDQDQALFKPEEPVTRAEVAYWAWKLKFDF